MRIMLNTGAPDVVLAAEHVSFAYGDETVLADVSLAVRVGEFAALAGPNGSGKSTLLRILLGLLSPRTGSAALFGVAPSRLHDRWRVGYVPQRLRIAPDLPATVEEVVAAGRLAKQGWWRLRRASDREAVDHALESVALEEFRRRRIGELSGGQQQRALIAKALAAEPELLVLDEPIAGVDVESQRLFRDSLVHLVREHQTAVLLVSHELGAVADDLDHIVVLKQRVLFDGTPADLAATGVSLGVHRSDLPLWLEELQS
ncbi:MAG TPA: metal ABC transporter ATP-binding protein [Acidimicrobiia bacterium]|nr:metal ABC transporter ATP-binding protein [Acidimicrobiia bacterium]